jgi:hypothetical protein
MTACTHATIHYSKPFRTLKLNLAREYHAGNWFLFQQTSKTALPKSPFFAAATWTWQLCTCHPPIDTSPAVDLNCDQQIPACVMTPQKLVFFMNAGPWTYFSFPGDLVLRHISRKFSSFVCLLVRVLLLFLVPLLS